MADNLILTTEPAVSISGLTYDNIIKDIYNLIKDNRELSENITDYTSADAVRMLTELFAWTTEQLSQRIDLIGNEMFLDTVIKKANLMRMLKLIGYKLDLPECASARFTIVIEGANQNSEDEYTLSNSIGTGDRIILNNASFKKLNHASSGKVFELIEFDEALKKYDYFAPISVKTTGVNTDVVFHEGTTTTKNIRITSLGYSAFTLSGPVINNSIRLFYTNKIDGAFVELTQVDNFYSKSSQLATTPIYKVNNLGDGNCIVEFPHVDDVKSEALVQIGDEITIIYRIGGGESGNILVNSITGVQEIWLNNGTIRGYIRFNNTSAGQGGRNEKTFEEIKRTAPQDIRNRISAVTAEDYEYLLKNLNSKVKDVKAYGENNIPLEANLLETYGYSRSPLDVWLFVIKENAIYNHSMTNITDYINDIQFQSLDLNERLNELYQVNRAIINEPIYLQSFADTGTKLDYSANPVSIYNSLTATLPNSIIKELQNVENLGNIKIAVTEFPFDDHEGNTDPENDNKYYLFDDTYYYVDTTKIPRNTIRFLEGKVIPIFSDINTIGISFKRSEDMESVTIPVGSTIEFTINDGSLNVITFEGGVSPISNFIDETNTKFNALLNDANHAVKLRENITDTEVTSGKSGTITFSVRINGIEEYDFSCVANGETWTDLVTVLNGASPVSPDTDTLSSLGLTFGLADPHIPDSDCKDLVIYSNSAVVGFEFKSSSFDLNTYVSSEALVKVVGDNLDIVFVDYFSYDPLTFTLALNFDADIVKIKNTNFFNTLFNISPSDYEADYFTCSNIRALSLDNNNNLLIGRISPKEELPETIYVSCFLESNNTIKLGEYYDGIEENADVSIPTEIRALLKRNPLKTLYNTVYQESSREEDIDIADIYNSDYQVKITRRRIETETFNQIGNSEDPPTIKFLSSILPAISSGYFYLKVDGEDYTINGIPIEDGESVGPEFTEIIDVKENISKTFTNYATYENGFIKFDLSPFSALSTNILAIAIKNVFSDKISISTMADGGIYLQSGTNYYYSVLDFGSTSKEIMKALFFLTNYEVKKFYSSGMFVPVQKIDFLKFTIVDGKFQKDRTIKLQTNLGTYEVSTGSTLSEFVSNLEQKSDISVQGREIFLNKREKDSLFKLILEDVNTVNLKALKEMFYETKDLDETLSIIEVSKTTSGDYYIEKTDEGYYFVIVDSESFPVGDLYFHMIEDYRRDHIFLGGDQSNVFTDEYVWNNSIEDKKMLCVSHIFKQPKFIPFDLKLSVKISRNAGLNKEKYYRDLIYNTLMERYNAYNSITGEQVIANNIIMDISKIQYVSEVSVLYLGFNIEDLSDNSSSLEANFNEKLILSSKKERSETINNLTRVYPVHGLFIEVIYKS